MNIADYKELFIQNYKGSNKTIEQTLLILKKEGASQMDSLKVLMKVLKLSIQKADEIVLNSKVWIDLKDATIELRDEFSNYLESFYENS
ncbi:MAG: hypothetical protein MUC49_12430 [Raineya sp.]|jgi:hypothetical protein|nr:hypothetical protein [Raineya sp.]